MAYAYKMECMLIQYQCPVSMGDSILLFSNDQQLPASNPLKASTQTKPGFIPLYIIDCQKKKVSSRYQFIQIVFVGLHELSFLKLLVSFNPE